MTTDPRWYLDVINVLKFSALGQICINTMKWTTAGSKPAEAQGGKYPCPRCTREFLSESMLVNHCRDHKEWEVLMLVDSEAAARVSGVAKTVDYFG